MQPWLGLPVISVGVHVSVPWSFRQNEEITQVHHRLDIYDLHMILTVLQWQPLEGHDCSAHGHTNTAKPTTHLSITSTRITLQMIT